MLIQVDTNTDEGCCKKETVVFIISGNLESLGPVFFPTHHLWWIHHTKSSHTRSWSGWWSTLTSRSWRTSPQKHQTSPPTPWSLARPWSASQMSPATCPITARCKVRVEALKVEDQMSTLELATWWGRISETNQLLISLKTVCHLPASLGVARVHQDCNVSLDVYWGRHHPLQ